MKIKYFKNFALSLAFGLAFTPMFSVLAAPQALVITSGVQSVTADSAILSGRFQSNGESSDMFQNPTSIYFEYGYGSSLDFTTSSDAVWGDTDSSHIAISGLRPDTTYYYRAILTNSRGIRVGTTKSFRTAEVESQNNNGPLIAFNDDIFGFAGATGSNVAGGSGSNNGSGSSSSTSTVTRTVAGSGSSSNSSNTSSGATGAKVVDLDIDNDAALLKRGQVITYIVEVENISKKELDDVEVLVDLPEQLEYIHTSEGGFHEQKRTVVVELGDIEAGEDERFTITTRVAEDASPTSITVAATLTAESGTATYEEVEYEIDDISDGEVDGVLLTASARDAGIRLGSVLGWLLVAVLLVLVIRAWRKNRARREAMAAGTVSLPTPPAPPMNTRPVIA